MEKKEKGDRGEERRGEDGMERGGVEREGRGVGFFKCFLKV